MGTIRVSGIQMIVSERMEENLPRILDHIAASDADFLLFPEMSLTGYHGDFSDKAVRSAWRQIAAACRQSYVTALIGTGCKTNGTTHIQTRVFSDEGEVIGTHEKLVPTQGDRNFCQPGEELRLLEHRGLPFGCLICNDMWVTPGCGPYPDPRLSYQLSKKGARVIFHSVNSGSSAKHMQFHESNLALRAMEGDLHICTANAASTNGPINCSTGIMSPQGKWLTKCPRTGEQHYTYDIEVDTD